MKGGRTQMSDGHKGGQTQRGTETKRDRHKGEPTQRVFGQIGANLSSALAVFVLIVKLKCVEYKCWPGTNFGHHRFWSILVK